MEYQQIVCQATGKTVKADKMYKIRNNENCIENVVSICNNCPFADSNNPSCQNCYGTIAQNAFRQINEKTGRIKTEAIDYRNSFTKINDEYIDNMNADDFIKNLDIISNLNSCNWNHGQRIADNLRAYIYPATYKTDCFKCKNRCRQQGKMTSCENAKKYVESLGINLDNATEKQILEIQLPNNCICQEQTPRRLYV